MGNKACSHVPDEVQTESTAPPIRKEHDLSRYGPETPFLFIEVEKGLERSSRDHLFFNASSPSIPSKKDNIEFESKQNGPSSLKYHGLIECLHTSYSGHIPLYLSPDDFWTVIVQSIADHILQDPERHRIKLVEFDGKRALVVRRDDFVRGSQKNDWEGVLKEFEGKAMENIRSAPNGIPHKFVQHFSTTTPLHSFVYRSALMDSLQTFFDYIVETLCGIPTVVLTGTQSDWDRLLNAFENMEIGQFDPMLDAWDTNVRSILTMMRDIRVGIVKNSEAAAFFRNIYKFEGSLGSGGVPTVSGWICLMFLYLTQGDGGPRFYSSRHQQLSWKDDIGVCGVSSDSFPSGLSRVPFTWKYMGDSFAMVVEAGFCRAVEYKGGVKSSVGYCIKYDNHSVGKSDGGATGEKRRAAIKYNGPLPKQRPINPSDMLV